MPNFIFHEGVKRKSGRYPYGSGEVPYQHEPWFKWRKEYQRLKNEGYSQTELAKLLSEEKLLDNPSTAELRAKNTIYRSEEQRAMIAYARRLRDEKKLSNSAIATKLGVTEGTVRNLLKPGADEKAQIHNSIADTLKKDIDSKRFVDIGAGVEANMGISREKLRAATTLLEQQGYVKYKVSQKQAGSGETITVFVLGKPDPNKTDKENYKDACEAVRQGIAFPSQSEDGGRTFKKIEPPVNISSSRIMIRHSEEGGGEKDGVIEIRRGVEDLNIGDRVYCQARIAVDNTHYLKGMVVYSDDMPKGVDIIFNTNKSTQLPKEEVFKKQDKSDQTNPFKTSFNQHYYTDKNGDKKLSAINIVNDDESFDSWKKSLSSQVLSKQRPEVARQQLQLQEDLRAAEYKDIMSITNPVIKRKLLESFASSCDSDAVHLQAAAMPGQKSHVILPSTKIKENEIYAPNYNNGDRVILIRHPHGGPFEIPELVVNNRNKSGKDLIDRSDAAVVIHPNVAKVLSGADFDGDTVLVIPNNKGLIRRESPLKSLENFDPHIAYPGGVKAGLKEVGPDKSKGQDGFKTGLEMGKITNLITDMQVKGADKDEIARAVKHSMVVIDAEKHQLDYKTSYKDNRIAELKEKYQGGKNKGASTVISKAKSETSVFERERRTKINPKTGEVIYVNTNKQKRVKNEDGTYSLAYDKNGNPIMKTQKSTKMMETTDAFSLVNEKGKYKIETIYATHANNMKKMANEARKQSLNVKDLKYEPSAAKTYSKEVASLKEKIMEAEKNRPFERKAQGLAMQMANYQIQQDPVKYDSWEAKQKLRGRLLKTARETVGAKKQHPQITNKEWKAIQAGAISKTSLSKLINHMSDEELKSLAMPKMNISLTPSQLNMAKSMYSRGYTQKEIANMLGVSPSTISKAVK